MQTYDTADRLRLEVEAAPPDPVAISENHDGALGGFGWETPNPGDRVDGVAVDPIPLSGVGPVALRFYVTPGPVTGPSIFRTNPATVTPGQKVSSYLKLRDDTYANNVDYLARSVEYLDEAGAVIATIAGTTTSVPVAGTGDQFDSHGFAPAGAAAARLVLSPQAGVPAAPAPSGAWVTLAEAWLGAGSPETGGLPSFLAAGAPRVYLDVLGSSVDLKLTRAALDVGVLSGTILAPDLDPATSDALAPGRRVKLSALDDAGVWRRLFTGDLEDLRVEYRLRHPEADKRTRIELTAVDNTRPLTAEACAEGVETVDELPALLEGAGVPWRVNGNRGHYAGTAVVVAYNDQASVLDQIAVTRDTALGAAWVDVAGVLNVYDADQLPTTPVAVADETYYDDLELGFDTAACINDVRFAFLRHNPGTGATEEVPYGPYRDDASIRRWGAHTATFTIQGAGEDEAALEARAATILAANANPTRRVLGLDAVARDVADFGYDAGRLVFLDLYDRVTVTNTRAGLAHDAHVTGIEHTITPHRWEVRLTFADPTSVASPQATPSPGSTVDGKTLAELLRPVGEVTDYYGLPANLWPGWRLLDGSALGDEPELEAWLTLNGLPVDFLPDFTDRIAVGAGVKSVGAKSGSWAKTLTVAQLPPHSHPAAWSGSDGNNTSHYRRGDAAANTGAGVNIVGTTGEGAPVDVTPPVLALYKVIRSRSGAPAGVAP